jgi:hypothetical protein
MPELPPVGPASADESFQESPDAKGFSVLAAVVFDHGAHDHAREMLLDLRGHRATKLHWNEMDRHERRTAAHRLAGISGLHVVTVGSPVPHRRQERARAVCLTRLVHELHGYGVRELLVEARTDVLNKRDVTTVTGARHRLSVGTRFRVTHQPGAVEPLFWAADIVAGAVRAHRLGTPTYWELLTDRLYEIDVDTDCGSGETR